MKITCCTCRQEHIDNPDIWGHAAKIEVSPENAARLLHMYRWWLTEFGWECGIHHGIPEGQTFTRVELPPDHPAVTGPAKAKWQGEVDDAPVGSV